MKAPGRAPNGVFKWGILGVRWIEGDYLLVEQIQFSGSGGRFGATTYA